MKLSSYNRTKSGRYIIPTLSRCTIVLSKLSRTIRTNFVKYIILWTNIVEIKPG